MMRSDAKTSLFKEMGQTSVALLHSLIASKNHMNVNIALPFKFIERESTSRPKI
ncbi:MAG: hypothetical protein WC136_09815 [Sphaerochaeta sp.]